MGYQDLPKKRLISELMHARQKNAELQSEIENNLKRRLQYEKMVANISTLAIASDDPDVFQQKCLEIVGETLDLSRTYIFRHRPETETMDNTFEWFAPGISPQKEHLQALRASDVPWWVEMMRENRIINYRDIEELPCEAEKNLLRTQQIQSVLVVPLFVKKAYYGFIGFDECRYRREWPPEDVALLKTVSEIIVLVIEREKDRHELTKNEALLRATIESLPFDLFVIDKDGRYSIINSTLRSRWGEALGKRPEELTGDMEIRRRWLENNRRAFSGETVRGEVQYNVNGRIENFYNVISPVRIGREVNGIVGINIDLTDLKRMEEELRSSEKRYRDLLENMSEVLYVLDRSGRITFVCPAVLSVAQYSPSEVIGRHADKFIYKEDLPRYRKNLKAVLANKKPDGNEYRIVTKSGDIRWVETSVIPVHAGSEITAIQGLFLDITERKLAEEALRKSEALLGATERLTRVGGWEWDLEKQSMFWTEEVYRIHDLDPEEIAPGSPQHIQKSLQCFDPADRPVVQAAFRTCVERGEAYDLEFPFTTVKGRRLWIRTTARAILENEKIVKVYGNILDVTERKHAEEALRENEERFRAIFDNAAVGMALTSMSGHILRTNDAFCRFLGYSKEELADMHFSEVTHPHDLDADTNLYQELIDGVRTSYMLDKRYLRKDGQVVWGRLGLSIIRDLNGSPKYAIGTCEDITDRKQAEQELRRAKEELELRVRERTAELSRRAAQLARLTSQLTLAEQMERQRLAGILHDHLQQFLIAAKINCEVLSANIGPGHQQEAENIIALISQSIQTSRTLTAELSPPVLQQCRLSAALEWLVRWMRENHGLTVELQTDPSLDPKPEDTTILLFQSIRELLLNVVKHAGVKSARVDMARDAENRLRVAVIDRGCGFDPDTVWTTEQGGTGFGLLSIRERVTLMGGSLEVESSPGSGAAFTLVVPL